MADMNDDQQKIRSRLRRYERSLQKEKKEHGFHRDGAGKRYQIGAHCILLGDNEGARDAATALTSGQAGSMVIILERLYSGPSRGIRRRTELCRRMLAAFPSSPI
jgi:hypothetical protein